jgi:hypothetical protein
MKTQKSTAQASYAVVQGIPGAPALQQKQMLAVASVVNSTAGAPALHAL